MKLGDGEFALIGLLQEDCKQSLKQLSKKLKMPMSTVHEKIMRLEEEGYVKSYAAIVDAEKLGLPVTAFILVNTETHRNGKALDYKAIAHELSKIPLVQEVHVITGEYDMLVKAKGRDMREIGEKVIDRVRAVDGVSQTRTTESYYSTKESPRVPV